MLDNTDHKCEYAFLTTKRDYDKYKNRFIIPDITFIFKDDSSVTYGSTNWATAHYGPRILGSVHMEYCYYRNKPMISMGGDCLHTVNILNTILNKYSNCEVLCTPSQRVFYPILDDIADITYGFVGADLAALAREAAMNALRQKLPDIDLEKPIPTEIMEEMKVTIDDFKNAHRGIEPSALREFFVEIPKVSWDDVGGLEDVKQSLKEAVESTSVTSWGSATIRLREP
jgi:hypothetical protein